MADWTELGSAVMKAARTDRGLSYEAASRLLHVSSKTYERREKAGRWPTRDIDALAHVLGLEIERPERARVTLGEEAVPVGLVERLEAVADELAAAATTLAAVVEAQSASGAGARLPARPVERPQ